MCRDEHKREGVRLGTLLLLITAAATSGSTAPIRFEGNFDLQAEVRRDADQEFDNRNLGFDRSFPQTVNQGKRPPWDIQISDPRVELRAYAYPAQPIEIYAKILHDRGTFNGVGVSEGHAKYRQFSGSGDNERGFESFFFYRQGRLNVGDPIITITNDHFGNGISTEWRLGRGEYTLEKGKWSGEFNLQNFTSEGRNAVGDEPEAYASKIRHDYRHSADLNIANELFYVNKTFTDPASARQHNHLFGTALNVAYKTTNLALQYNISEGPRVDFASSGNDAFGANLNNLVFFDNSRFGRLGVNATVLNWGERYTNFLGRGPEFVTLSRSVANGSDTTVGTQIRRDHFGELFWDVPKYQANLVLRHQDKWGTGILRELHVSNRNEADLNLKLKKNFDLRFLYTRTGFGFDEVFVDSDASRSFTDVVRTNHDFYSSLKMNRTWGAVKIDNRYYRIRSNTLNVSGIEASYKITPRITLLARGARVGISQPERYATITTDPATNRRVSLVEPFSWRKTMFLQLLYKPTDNSQFLLEYGQGFHTDNDLSLDGDILAPSRRTDPRIFTKLEMWF